MEQILTEASFTSWVKNKINSVKDKINRGSIKSGGIYLYDYRAKGYEDDTLMFYDQFPLVIVTGSNGTHHTGIQFNYLPIRLRKKMLKRLKTRYKKQWSKNELLPNFRWKIVSKELEHAPFIVKQYIKSRCKRITRIAPEELDNLVFIDTSKFKFKKDSELKTVKEVWDNWRKSASLQKRTRIKEI